MKRFCVLVLFLVISVSARAIDVGAAFEDPEMQARYEAYIGEVRCLVCQNQTIKDSNVFLASDLRREIRRMMAEGMTNGEISDFLVSRYGDFVLYNPPKSGKTLILWIVPTVLVGLGGIVIVRVVRDRMRMPIDDDALDS